MLGLTGLAERARGLEALAGSVSLDSGAEAAQSLRTLWRRSLVLCLGQGWLAPGDLAAEAPEAEALATP